MTSRRITRRRFLLLGSGTTLSVFVGGAYLKGGCPLSNSGICVGPCAAFIDRNHDQICDRIQDLQALAQDPAPSTAHQPQELVSCPFGLVNDPYPGQCAHYVDQDGNGFCDLSEMVKESDREPTQAPAEAAQAQAPPTPTPTRRVACPFGLVNDPYPGKCRRYVDKNNNGICDLSEMVEDSPDKVEDSPDKKVVETLPETKERQRKGKGRHRGSDGS